MFPIEVEPTFRGPRYAVIAWANKQTVLFYEEYGSYQGEWLMFSKGQTDYYLYKGSFGSCSGCDDFEATFNGAPTMAAACEFAKEYDPFLVVPFETMANVVRRNRLGEIIPANMRGGYGEIDFDRAVTDMSMAVRLEEGLEILPADILAVGNQEIQGRAMQVVGYDRLITELAPISIEHTEQGELLSFEGMRPRMVAVIDPSTKRRYLLRVPPTSRGVQEALAWTFGMTANEYAPLVEA